MKRCAKCGISKDTSEYYAHNNTRDKLQPKCKDCQREERRNRHKMVKDEKQGKMPTINPYYLIRGKIQ